MASFIPPVGMAAGFYNASKEPKDFLTQVLGVPKEHQIKIKVSIDEDISINGDKPHYFLITSPVLSEALPPIEFDIMCAKLIQELSNKLTEVKKQIYDKTSE